MGSISSSELRAFQRTIFQKGSNTYFNSSFFFPKQVQERVFTLYAFVRAGLTILWMLSHRTKMVFNGFAPMQKKP
jgi:hypothetical protein